MTLLERFINWVKSWWPKTPMDSPVVSPPVVVAPPPEVTPPVTPPPVTTPPVAVPAPPVVTPPVVTPPVVTPPPVTIYRYPADVVGRSWKVTLEDGKDIKQPQLATYSDKNFFVSGEGAVMRAHWGAGHTANSLNSRCEWREMSPDGKTEASWSCAHGHHQMRAEFSVDRHVESRPHVVVGQIHGVKPDLTVFRLEGSSLWVTKGNTTHAFLVTSSFRLGERHSVGFDVRDGVVRYLYDDKLINYQLNATESGCYMKSGLYLQANPKTDPSGKPSEFAQVTIYSLTVSHT
jgi:hypothetical protein